VGHFVLHGEAQTIRRLTFEGFSFAILLGIPGSTLGGYTVERCVFRNGLVAFEFDGFSDDVTTVEDNEFINVFQTFVILGKTVHYRDNRVSFPDLPATPFGRPANVGLMIPDVQSGGTVCENNVFEKNTIIGNADGFFIGADGEQMCRHNVIRENTFVNQRIFSFGDNATMVWAAGSGIQGNLIQDNVLRRSEGIGIIIEAGSDNRIIGNSFSKLPGGAETTFPYPGTAIFLGEPTTGNRVLDNTFKKVVNTVVDLGTGNIVDVATLALGAPVSAQRAGPPARPKLLHMSARATR
jgi:parallel beta-helix repeat protein